MSLRVIITRDFDHMSEVAGGMVRERGARTMAERGAFVLGLATGHSPTGVYKLLADHNCGQKLNRNSGELKSSSLRVHQHIL